MQLKRYALFAVAALIATGLASLAPVQQATAQTSAIPDLAEADCETTFKPLTNSDGNTGNATDFTVNQCKALVRFRNAIADNPENQNFANHSMAQWGTASTPEGKRMTNWTGLAIWGNPLQVTQIDIGVWQRGTNGQQNRYNKAFLGGAIPELDLDDPEVPGNKDTGLFGGLNRIGLNGNRFTGSIPEWIYKLPKLGYLNLSDNDLSGPVSGEGFVSPVLLEVGLSGNNFSGRLPDFNFAKHPRLTRLVLSGNSFSGNIPAGYSGLADGRPINDLNLNDNQLSGAIPDWVKSTNLKFSDGTPVWSEDESGGHGTVIRYFKNRMDFGNNRLCIPNNFRMPTLYEEENPSVPASIWINFARNRCPRGENVSDYIPSPVENLTYSISSSALTVTFTAPEDSNSASYKYSVIPQRIAAPFPIDSSVSYGDHCIVAWPYTPNSEGVYTVTHNKAILDTQRGCRFDPEKFAVDVTTNYEIGGNRADGNCANCYRSESSSEPGWNILHVKESRSVREIGWKVGLGLDDSFYTWDLDNQAWIRWDLDDSSLDSAFPEIGTSIITTNSRPPAWLKIAGLSSADKDLPVQLGNGWNMISAGGDATRPNNDNGAFFFDEALLDCDSLAGTLAIMRYRSRSERFDVELPCHPSSERTLTRGGSRGLIAEIEEYDSLFVYFNSALPVCIQWDDEDSKYEAVGAGDC